MVDQVQPVLDLFEFHGIKSQVHGIIGQGPVEIRKQGIDLRQLVCQIVQFLIESCYRSQFPASSFDTGSRALIGIDCKIKGALDRLIDPAKAPHQTVLFLKLFVLALFQGRLFNLPDLIGQQVRLPFTGRLVQVVVFPLVPQFTVTAPGSADPALQFQGMIAREFVQGHQLLVSFEQPLVLPLSVNIDQQLGNLPQLPQGHGLAADGADAPAGHDLTLDQNGPVLFHGQVHLPQAFQLTVVVRLEDHLDQGVVLTGPDDGFIRLGAQGQVDTAQDDGFTRAGLTGQDIQSVAKADFLLLDQRQIFHMKAQ